MANDGHTSNGWTLYEKKILADIERLERNQLRIFQKQEEHGVALATLFARISMLSGAIAFAVSIAVRLFPGVA